jgi:probable HAF family extracellular repeat protein
MTIHNFLRTLYYAAQVVALAWPAPAAPQEDRQNAPGDRFPHYVDHDLGTLGGPYSYSYNLNGAGVVSGGSATSTQNGDPSQAITNAPQTAFLWHRGKLRNLGTLGGPDSAAAAANLSHLAVVDSETARFSRQGEDVCAFGTHLQCLAALWVNGELKPLHLLPGGNNSYALDMNDHGQVVGFADTDTYDLDSAAARTAGFRFQATIWEPNGAVRRLAPLNSDTVAYAFGINNGGQTVGVSGVCAGLTPPPYPSPGHTVLWERDGTAVDLGAYGSASAINEHGDISGTISGPDGALQAFLWTPETRKAVQLELPAGFVAALNPCCKTINNRREIVGFMFNADFTRQHAFLWKDGVTVDLNDLLPQGSPWLLQAAAGINESGQIAGQGMINGEVHAFLASPCHQHRDRAVCCDNHDH